jgi:hypothetical protein
MKMRKPLLLTVSLLVLAAVTGTSPIHQRIIRVVVRDR